MHLKEASFLSRQWGDPQLTNVVNSNKNCGIAYNNQKLMQFP